MVCFHALPPALPWRSLTASTSRSAIPSSRLLLTSPSSASSSWREANERPEEVAACVFCSLLLFEGPSSRILCMISCHARSDGRSFLLAREQRRCSALVVLILLERSFERSNAYVSTLVAWLVVLLVLERAEETFERSNERARVV